MVVPGVGMAHENPQVGHHDEFTQGKGDDGVFEAGKTVCSAEKTVTLSN